MSVAKSTTKACTLFSVSVVWWKEVGMRHCTLDFTTPPCCTNLNFSIFCRAQRYKPVMKEWLEQKRVARSCNYMDHHHAWFPRPTALHTLLPGVSFVSQHISGMSLNKINMQQWTGCSCFTSCPVWIFGHLYNFQFAVEYHNWFEAYIWMCTLSALICFNLFLLYLIQSGEWIRCRKPKVIVELAAVIQDCVLFLHYAI